MSNGLLYPLGKSLRSEPRASWEGGLKHWFHFGPRSSINAKDQQDHNRHRCPQGLTDTIYGAMECLGRIGPCVLSPLT